MPIAAVDHNARPDFVDLHAVTVELHFVQPTVSVQQLATLIDGPKWHGARGTKGDKSARAMRRVKVWPGDDGRPNFARLHVRWTRPGTIHLWAFDLLAFNGRDLRLRPLVKRQAVLQALLERFGCP